MHNLLNTKIDFITTFAELKLDARWAFFINKEHLNNLQYHLYEKCFPIKFWLETKSYIKSNIILTIRISKMIVSTQNV
jgi:hypothetical protein